MVTFLGNPVSFTGKQLQSATRRLIFLSLQQTFLKNLWLILMERKKSWVSCLLSIQVSAQLKRVVLMKNWLDWTTQSSWLFLWTYLLLKTLVWCWRHWNAIMLSDYFDHSFGRDYALLINEWHLLARAVFVLDTDNTIRYVEYVDNINSEPKLEAAIAAAKAL